MSAPTVSAQQVVNLGKRVIHLYVDPVYGEDEARMVAVGDVVIDCAERINPGPNLTAPACGLTPNYPTEVIDQGRVLLHTPAPFRTITRAIASIPALPKNTAWLDSSTSTTYNVTWSHAIVHLLPGVYARGQPLDSQGQFPGPEIYDWANGLRHNREVFPIRVPQRVSIQGTNALNTLIEIHDAGGTETSNRPGPAFEFGTTTISADEQTVACNGEGTYIDSVTIHGSILDPSGTNTLPAPKENAGIYIGDGMASAPTISNCVFFGNTVGISVAASTTDAAIRHHATRIINNTFVANAVGIWNGQAGSGFVPLTPAIGYSELIIVNNVFQPYFNSLGYNPPNGLGCNYGGQTVPGAGFLWQHWRGNVRVYRFVAFEGIHFDDLNTYISPSTFKDFNAYEVDVVPSPPGPPVPNANSGTVWFGTAIGATVPRPSPPTQTLAPAVNLAGITGWPGTGTSIDDSFGILFVRDLFCNAVAYSQITPPLPPEFVAPAATGPSFDGSPHDFRLAPVTTDSGQWTSPPGVRIPDLMSANSRLNPLVDAGYWGPTIAQKNGRTVDLPGVLLPTSDPDHSKFPYNTWIWDLEGHGNPRVHDHPLYPNTGTGAPIDIGADEMGELICAGYRYGTTSFSYAATNAVLPANPGGARPLPMDNKYMWYLGPPTAGTVFSVASKSPPQLRLVDWPTRQGNCQTTPVTPGWLHYPRYYASAHPAPALVPWYSPPSVTGLGQPNCAPSGGLMFEPWRFTTRTTPVTCAGYYGPTIADVTPHLLPDVHPWWHVALQTSPTNPIWWNCSSIYNGLLYLNPNTNRTNPPGSYLGGSIAVAGPPPSTLWHRWLDYSSFLGQPVLTASNFVSLHDLSLKVLGNPTLRTIDGFTSWCVGFENPTFYRTTFPHTEDERTSGAELLGVRLSLEQGYDSDSASPRRGGTWSGMKDTSNLQSFLVFVEK